MQTPVRKLAAQLGKKWPGFKVKGRLLYDITDDLLLRGLILDSSSFSKTSFYPTFFVQPLYASEDYIFFNYGSRLRGWSEVPWDLTQSSENTLVEALSDCISNTVIPFHNQLSCAADLARACEHPDIFGQPFGASWVADDIHVHEHAGCSYVLAGDIERSLKHLLRVKEIVDDDDAPYDWVVKLGDRCGALRELLQAGKVPEAVQQLQGRAEAAKRALRLD